MLAASSGNCAFRKRHACPAPRSRPSEWLGCATALLPRVSGPDLVAHVGRGAVGAVAVAVLDGGRHASPGPGSSRRSRCVSSSSPSVTSSPTPWSVDWPSPALGGQGERRRARLEHDVDHARDGVGAVLRGRAVAQDLDLARWRRRGWRSGPRPWSRGRWCRSRARARVLWRRLPLIRTSTWSGPRPRRVAGRTVSAPSAIVGRGKLNEGASAWMIAWSRVSPAVSICRAVRMSTGTAFSASTPTAREPDRDLLLEGQAQREVLA